MKNRKCIIMVGPPGAGKGTQAKVLSNTLGIPHISTGDILRNEIHNKTDIGKTVEKLIEKGELVSDELILSLLRKRVSSEDCEHGYILDGIPRTVNQLQKMMEFNIGINYALILELSSDSIKKRISGRRVHLASGRVYNIYYSPPKVKDLDDETGELLTHRKDDQLSVVENRIDVYNSQTKPIISNLENLKDINIIKIDAEQNLKEITKELLDKLN